jgi:hypothetical protein
MESVIEVQGKQSRIELNENGSITWFPQAANYEGVESARVVVPWNLGCTGSAILDISVRIRPTLAEARSSGNGRAPEYYEALRRQEREAAALAAGK